MDAAIYHPTRGTIFSVRAGYIFEYSLALVQGSTSKFINPCFSKSCLAYDSGLDKLWVGTMGDWAAGRTGDPGSGAAPSKTNSGLYRINPATLALELAVYPNDILFGQVTTGTYNMPSAAPYNNPPVLFGTASGFYDLIYVGGNLWGCMCSDSAGGELAYMVSFDASNVVGSNYLERVLSTTAFIQCTYDPVNGRIWFNQCIDLFFAGNPWATNANWSSNALNIASIPVPSGASGIVYSPAGGGFLYLAELTGTALIKYNLDGSINSSIAMGGASLGGQPMRLRYNSLDNLIYIPCPATNAVIAFNPVTDTVSHIYTVGLDAPHDIVFAPGGHKIAVQNSSSGLKELTT